MCVLRGNTGQGAANRGACILIHDCLSYSKVAESPLNFCEVWPGSTRDIVLWQPMMWGSHSVARNRERFCAH